MATEAFTNFPATTVPAGAGPISGSDTWVVSSSDGFPTASTGVTQFHVADTNQAASSELILVTNMSGTGDNTWAVTRGAEGTNPVAHEPEFTITAVITAGWLNAVSGTSLPEGTPGALLYTSPASATAWLGGNTTGTKEFLTSTGAGGTANTPIWGTISASDGPFTGLMEPLASPVTFSASPYSAAPGQYIPVDTTSGNVTVKLPSAPSDKSIVGIKQVIQGSTNTVTFSTSGTDVINKTGGGTAGTLALASQGVIVQYYAASSIWYVYSDDLPLSQLDQRYQTVTPNINYPSANGLIAWTYDAYQGGGGNSTLAAGTVYLQMVQIHTAGTVGSAWAAPQVAGGTAASGESWLGLYTQGGTLIAAGSTDSLVTSSTFMSVPLTVQAGQSLTLPPASYYVAILVNAGAMPQYLRGTGTGSIANYNSSVRAGTGGTGRTTLAGTVTPLTTNSPIAFWAGLS